MFVVKLVFLFLLWGKILYSKVSKEFRKSDYPYHVLFFLFFGYCVFNIFISSFDPLVWFIGLISYFFYAVYALAVPIGFKSENNILYFMKAVICVSFVCYIFGILQYYLPPSHFLNRYASDSSEYIALAGGSVRITSIFNYIAGFTTFISFSLPITFLGYLISDRIWPKLFCLMVLSIGLFNVFATGSRAIVAYVFISKMIVLFSYNNLFRLKSKIKSLGFATFFVAVLFFLFANNYFDFDSYYTFNDRLSGVNDSSVGRVFWMLSAVPDAFDKVGFGGLGLGGTNNIVLSMGKGLGSGDNLWFLTNELDQLLSRIIIEIGLSGFFIYASMMIFMMYDICKKTSAIKDPNLKILSITLASTIIQYFTMMNSNLFNWLGSVHFSLVVGFIICIYNVDKTKINNYKNV
ncbi:hypothetical protein A7E75_12115 [Syntrophotalea acetylenica]|uniref:O-antigen polymerase n=1 Tax=Syntrophotalea acetylenica TaxID=29542 RepID=A0A1L3GIC6_SYNAC|nr:hypothetical protein A7E75_12115 [Syntrophotalea acetylenica]